MKKTSDYFNESHYEYMSRFISTEYEIRYHNDLKLSPTIWFNTCFLISYTHWSGKRVEHYLSLTDIETIYLSMLYHIGKSSYSYKVWKRVYKACKTMMKNYVPICDNGLPF